jgi:hypothetical protein
MAPGRTTQPIGPRLQTIVAVGAGDLDRPHLRRRGVRLGEMGPRRQYGARRRDKRLADAATESRFSGEPAAL